MKYWLILLLFFTFDLKAQHRNDKWCFGDSAGIDFSNLSNPLPIHSLVKSRGSCASICDTNGNLLFYSSFDTDLFNGAAYLANGEVYNRFHQIMQNGDSIYYQSWYMECVIIPFPDDTSKYYLFTIGVTSNYGLYYSIIDMNLDSGRGAVSQKNIQLLLDPANDGLTAVKQGNGRDWWLIHRKYQGSNNTFYKFLITPTGINGPFIQNIGSMTTTNTCRYIFNKDGDKLAMVLLEGLTEIYDFERCTGNLSNPVLIRPKSSPSPRFWSCAFSPNNRFLYISSNKATASYLMQIDLQNPSPWQNCDTLWIDSSYAFMAQALRLAPDNKIYLTCAWNTSVGFNYPCPDSVYVTQNTNLSVINSPDSLGTACNFTPFSFYLGGGRTYWGLPNNPDYDMPRIAGSPCDTIQWTGSPPTTEGGVKSLLYTSYISSWDKLFINAQHLKGTTYTLIVIDITGRQVFKENGRLRPPYFTKDLDCSGFAKGMYIVTLQTEKERLVRKFVKN